MGFADDDFATQGGVEALGLGMKYAIGMNNIGSSSSSSSSVPIDSSNIGFKLLKKHGWKEGTGLGIAEQGMLEPIEAYVKKNKRGLGAEKVKKAKEKSIPPEKHSSENEEKPSYKRLTKGLSKKMKKMQEFEKRLKEKELERDFYREFWPDNV